MTVAALLVVHPIGARVGCARGPGVGWVGRGRRRRYAAALAGGLVLGQCRFACFDRRTRCRARLRLWCRAGAARRGRRRRRITVCDGEGWTGTGQAVWLAGHASPRMAVRTRRAVRSGNPDRCRRPDRRSPSLALPMGAVAAPSRTRPLPQYRHLSLADRMGDVHRLGKARRASRLPLQPTRSARSLTCSAAECRCPRRTSRASSSPARQASKARWSWTVYRLGRLRAGRSCGMDGVAVHPPGPTWHCPPAVGMAGSPHQSLRYLAGRRSGAVQLVSQLALPGL